MPAPGRAGWQPNERYVDAMRRLGFSMGMAAAAAEAVAEVEAEAEARAAAAGEPPPAAGNGAAAGGQAAATAAAPAAAAAAAAAAGLRPSRTLDRAATACRAAARSLSRGVAGAFDPRAMALHLGTAATNEHVPLNETGYLLPWWQRAAVRCSYVLLVAAVTVLVVSAGGGRVCRWWLHVP